MAKRLNPLQIGLSAGCDSHCSKFNRIASKGYSIIETGPLRLNEIHGAIERLKRRKSDCIIATSIKADPDVHSEEEVLKNIEKKFSYLYDFFDVFTFDITQQNEDYSNELLEIITKMRLSYDENRIILVRLSKSLDKETADNILNNCRLYNIDGVISSDWERLVESVGGRYPICAEIDCSEISKTCGRTKSISFKAASAIGKGISTVFLKDTKPKHVIIKRINKIVSLGLSKPELSKI